MLDRIHNSYVNLARYLEPFGPNVPSKDENLGTDSFYSYLHTFTKAYRPEKKVYEMEDIAKMLGITAEFVPQFYLGAYVLGCAIPGKKRMQILESLKGDKRNKVIAHEIHHILHPEDDEWMTRYKTDTFVI